MTDTPRDARSRARKTTAAPDRRSSGGIVIPRSRPSFRLHPEARVFHIGCAFARALEAGMARAGVRVTSLATPGDIEEVRSNAEDRLLSPPGPEQVRQELDWAAGLRTFREDGLVPVADGWADPCLGRGAAGGSLAMIRRRRSAVADYFARAQSADLVVVTLAETETWYDRRSKQALHGAPLQRFYRDEPERFGVRRLGHDEVVPILRGILRALRAGPGTPRVVFCVSPLPVTQTWTGEDLLTANMTVKSTLHAAIVSVTSGEEGADHFPAFEAVMHSDPSSTLTDDRQRLRGRMIDALAGALMDRYGLLLSADTRTLGSA